MSALQARSAEPQVPLGDRLRHAVTAAGGVRQVARLTGISEAQLYRYFKGMAVPSDRVIVLASACEVSIGWLFGEVD